MSKNTRRDILRTTAGAGSVAIASWFGPRAGIAEADSLTPQLAPHPELAPHPGAARTLSYFTPTEFAFIEAAVSRLIPIDELGPGAKQAGVAFFIDQQIAGSFGRAETWYMQGPWKEGTPEQGYQLKLTPAQLYRVAIQDIDDYCRRTFNKKTFAELGADDQDKILHGLEMGEIGLADAPAKEFFAMQQVKDSPDIDTNRSVSRQMETHVYDYYGWDPYWSDRNLRMNAMATPLIAPLCSTSCDPGGADASSQLKVIRIFAASRL